MAFRAACQEAYLNANDRRGPAWCCSWRWRDAEDQDGKNAARPSDHAAEGERGLKREGRRSGGRGGDEEAAADLTKENRLEEQVGR
jgi:hypothetical protein